MSSCQAYAEVPCFNKSLLPQSTYRQFHMTSIMFYCTLLVLHYRKENHDMMYRHLNFKNSYNHDHGWSPRSSKPQREVIAMYRLLNTSMTISKNYNTIMFPVFCQMTRVHFNTGRQLLEIFLYSRLVKTAAKRQQYVEPQMICVCGANVGTLIYASVDGACCSTMDGGTDHILYV